MRTVSERPNAWYLIVTLFAMLYLSSVAKAVISALVQNNSEPARQTAGAIVTLLVVLAWLYLLRDLIRQISLFFRKGRR